MDTNMFTLNVWTKNKFKSSFIYLIKVQLGVNML